MVRAFFAVDVEEESVVRNIVSFQNELLRVGANGLKPVEPENLHITLLFLGELNEAEVNLAAKALETIESKSFEIEFGGTGYFPGGSRINVIWVGIRSGVEELKNIHSNLKRRLPSFRLEDDKFVPHLTVCRVKFVRNKAGLLEAIAKNVPTTFGNQRVEKISLKKSVLTSTGPVYSDLAVKKI
ncbi:MAG: RNA 2',3'-cyclic phosphodiesterase [Candidatus Caldarchaeum sp.]|nr:RNA 2',3'-cyclic phosphodiesterase [Candidatus Caldarchaeum sp.]